MNVALLTITWEWGGTESHAVELARTLSERGHTATIVCLSERTYQFYRDRSRRQINLATLFLPKDPWRMGFRDWLRLFVGRSWDVCFLIKGEFFLGGWSVDLAARFRFDNYITLEQLQAPPLPLKSSRRHLGFIPGLGLWWYQERLRRSFRAAGPKKVICVSDAVRERLTRDYHFPDSKVVTVHNGVDHLRFQRDPEHTDFWRRRWGIPASALVFGAIGRFSPVKGYTTAISSFQILLKHFPQKDLRLVLVGEGPQEKELRAIAQQIVPGRRVILSPFCDRPWEPLSALDIFVMPSSNEGLPLALVEAMACGCCPIATAVAGIPEVLHSPDLGWLVSAGDADAFTAAMIDAASLTPDQRAAMGARCRERVVANFNASVQLNVIADIIESYAPTALGLSTERPIGPRRPS